MLVDAIKYMQNQLQLAFPQPLLLAKVEANFLKE
jgi:hypothetical protein